MLRAVAVMEVPIDDQNPIETEGFPGISGPDGHIVVKTKPLGGRPFGVMPRRAHQCEGIVQPAGMNHFDGTTKAAGRQQGGFVGKGRGAGVGIQVNVVFTFSVMEFLDVFGRVDTQEFAFFGSSRCDHMQNPLPFGLYQDGLDNPNPLGTLQLRRTHAVIRILWINDDSRSLPQSHPLRSDDDTVCFHDNNRSKEPRGSIRQPA